MLEITLPSQQIVSASGFERERSEATCSKLGEAAMESYWSHRSPALFGGPKLAFAVHHIQRWSIDLRVRGPCSHWTAEVARQPRRDRSCDLKLPSASSSFERLEGLRGKQARLCEAVLGPEAQINCSHTDLFGDEGGSPSQLSLLPPSGALVRLLVQGEMYE